MPGNLTAPDACVTNASTTAACTACNVSFEESRAFAVAVYGAVCLLGLPANCLTAGLALRQAWRGSVLAVYLLGLALCELLYAGTLPLWALYVQRGHRWTLGPRACRAAAFVFFCNLYVSILLLCCVSCDRFAAVVYALESRGRRYRRRRTAALLSAAAFLLVGLVHYPVFRTEEVVTAGTCFETLPVDGRAARYYYARFALGFALPLGVLGFTNHRIVRAVGLSPGLSAAWKARARRTALAAVAIFLACFAPYHLLLLLKAAAFSYYGGRDTDALCRLEARLGTVSVAFLCLTTVNSVADPVLYVLAAAGPSRQAVSRLRGKRTLWSARTEAAKLACLPDSEAGARPGTWAPLGAPGRLGEGSC